MSPQLQLEVAGGQTLGDCIFAGVQFRSRLSSFNASCGNLLPPGILPGHGLARFCLPGPFAGQEGAAAGLALRIGTGIVGNVGQPIASVLLCICNARL